MLLLYCWLDGCCTKIYFPKNFWYLLNFINCINNAYVLFFKYFKLSPIITIHCVTSATLPTLNYCKIHQKLSLLFRIYLLLSCLIDKVSFFILFRNEVKKGDEKKHFVCFSQTNVKANIMHIPFPHTNINPFMENPLYRMRYSNCNMCYIRLSHHSLLYIVDTRFSDFNKIVSTSAVEFKCNKQSKKRQHL